MRCLHLVRVGALGQVGRFSAADGTQYPRASRVVVRTSRGLEVGEVLAGPGNPDAELESDGTILRGLAVEDELLLTRQAKNREAAYEACQTRIDDLQLPVTLMDVEHLFDGQTLVFYFLGPQPPELESVTAELAELYDSQVQFRSFVAAATAGCGPGCGTDEAAGCGSCSTGCAIAGACSTRKVAAAP
ncbi:MAG TPA: PSP1 domain-containing protein [Pirellulales bacterium]|nr:PSP1 domain-containing protein [Pirellulales bacterium]